MSVIVHKKTEELLTLELFHYSISDKCRKYSFLLCKKECKFFQYPVNIFQIYTVPKLSRCMTVRAAGTIILFANFVP